VKAIICPEGSGRYALEIYTDSGDWVMCLHHDATRTFLQDFAAKVFAAGPFSKKDELEIREAIHKAYHTLYTHA
jgi:hypothetical protein